MLFLIGSVDRSTMADKGIHAEDVGDSCANLITELFVFIQTDTVQMLAVICRPWMH